MCGEHREVWSGSELGAGHRAGAAGPRARAPAAAGHRRTRARALDGAPSHTEQVHCAARARESLPLYHCLALTLSCSVAVLLFYRSRLLVGYYNCLSHYITLFLLVFCDT